MKRITKAYLESMLDHVAESLLINLKAAYDSSEVLTDEEKKLSLALYCLYLLPMYEYLREQPYFEEYKDIWVEAYKAYQDEGPDFKCMCRMCEDIH